MTQKLTQILNLKQQHNLVMTPQMQQAVKLLQMSNIELQAFLEEEMVQNPHLEKQETEPDIESPETTEDNSDTDANDDSPPETLHEDAHEDFDAGNKMADVGAGLVG